MASRSAKPLDELCATDRPIRCPTWLTEALMVTTESVPSGGGNSERARVAIRVAVPVSYTHLDVYKRQATTMGTRRLSLMKGSAEGRLSKMIGTLPATVSTSAGPAPR